MKWRDQAPDRKHTEGVGVSIETEIEEEAEEAAAVAVAAGSSGVSASDSEEVNRWEKWENWIDAVIVTILAVASLAAAWSVYQSALWDGQQAAKYAQATARRLESNRQFTYGHQLSIVDVTTFTNYANAFFTGDTKLADFYVERFRPDFLPAFNAWIATNPLANKDAPTSPFVMPEYVLPQLQEADKLEAESTALFADGQDDNDVSDKYVLNTVFLATVLFFCGIAPRIRFVPAQVALITVAFAILVLGLYRIATYPIA
jgi:hypothetical protein